MRRLAVVLLLLVLTGCGEAARASGRGQPRRERRVGKPGPRGLLHGLDDALPRIVGRRRRPWRPDRHVAPLLGGAWLHLCGQLRRAALPPRPALASGAQTERVAPQGLRPPPPRLDALHPRCPARAGRHCSSQQPARHSESPRCSGGRAPCSLRSPRAASAASRPARSPAAWRRSSRRVRRERSAWRSGSPRAAAHAVSRAVGARAGPSDRRAPAAGQSHLSRRPRIRRRRSPAPRGAPGRFRRMLPPFGHRDPDAIGQGRHP